MNVDRMRRMNARVQQAEADRSRAAWLASLTPGHRARHEGSLGGMCPECINRVMAEAGARAIRVAEGIRLRTWEAEHGAEHQGRPSRTPMATTQG